MQAQAQAQAHTFMPSARRYASFMSSSFSNCTNAYPRDLPVTESFTIFTSDTGPYSSNTSCSLSSVVSYDNRPTNSVDSGTAVAVLLLLGSSAKQCTHTHTHKLPHNEQLRIRLAGGTPQHVEPRTGVAALHEVMAVFNGLGSGNALAAVFRQLVHHTRRRRRLLELCGEGTGGSVSLSRHSNTHTHACTDIDTDTDTQTQTHRHRHKRHVLRPSSTPRLQETGEEREALR